MTKADIGWLAGFWEGEGFAGCYRNRRKDSRNKNIIRYFYVLKVAICQRQKEPLVHCKKLLGYGSFFRGRGGYKNSFLWTWSAGQKGARKFLKLIRPYVINPYKQNQIDKALRKDKKYVTPK